MEKQNPSPLPHLPLSLGTLIPLSIAFGNSLAASDGQHRCGHLTEGLLFPNSSALLICCVTLVNVPKLLCLFIYIFGVGDVGGPGIEIHLVVLRDHVRCWSLK